MSNRIYVVEDELAIRRSLHLLLRVAGYEPRMFESGSALLDALPDLVAGCILLDVRMPEIDGLEVQRRLASAGTKHSVIVMSGHGELVTAITAFEQGAIAVLEKPFSRRALERALTLARLRLTDTDAYRGQLRLAARIIQQLGPGERRVLELLARGHDLRSVSANTGLALTEVEILRSQILSDSGSETVLDVLHLVFAARRLASL